MKNILYRNLDVSPSSINEELRTVEVVFSSEMRVGRGWWVEVLSHDAGAVDMSWIASGRAPFLLEHNLSKQVGVIESAEITPEKTGRATIRFSRSALGEEVFRDIADGIRKCISVGYEIKSLKLIESNDGVDTYLIDSWWPCEISSVPIPADMSVGVRSAGQESANFAWLRELMNKNIQTGSIEVMPNPNPNPTIDNATRQAQIVEIGNQYAKYVSVAEISEAVRSGVSVSQFQEQVMRKMSSEHTNAAGIEIGLTSNEVRRYSLQRAIEASVTGDWSKAGFERAASVAVEQKTGMSASGFFMPVEVSKRAFAAGAQNEGGAFVQTNVMADDYVDVLRNNVVLATLGARILGGVSGNIAIPRKLTAAQIATLAENAQAPNSRPTFMQIQMQPRRIGGQVFYSKQTAIQVNPDIEAMLQDDLLGGLAVQVDASALNGMGAAQNQALGLLNTPGIGSVVGGANGALINWGHIVDLETECAKNNAEPGNLAGYITNPVVRGALKKTQKAENLPFIWTDDKDCPVNGYRAALTNNISSSRVKGTSTNCSAIGFSSAWSDLVIAMFGGVDITVDSVTRAGTGEIVITANQYIDVAIRNPASFSFMLDGLTS